VFPSRPDFYILKQIHMPVLIFEYARVEFAGMKMQPKKLRSFAISSCKNKKIFVAGFSLEQGSFDLCFFDDAASCFYE